MTGEDIVQPFFMQHVDGFAQPVQQVGARRIGEHAARIRCQHVIPVPIGTRQPAGRLRHRQRLFADRIEAQPRRQHQTFLRPADGDIHAPFVMPEINGAERGNRIRHQQRRMARRVHRLADRFDTGGDPGRRVVVDNANGLDLVLLVFGQPGFDSGRIDTMAPVAFDINRIQPKLFGEVAP